ncbi:MAG: hypothetical protein AB1746_06620 [Candidatus Zixiibacteriota bacterium]
MNSKSKYIVIFTILTIPLIFIFSCGDNPVSSKVKPLPSVNGPGLYIPDSTFDFGYVPQNGTVSHEYRLYSVGDDTLKILDIRPG